MDTNALDHHHKTLFFLEGSVPTEAEANAAKGLKGQVSFRNALVVPDDGPIEHADAVAGLVPERYKVAYAAKSEIEKANEEQAKADDKARLATDFERGKPKVDNAGRNPNLPKELPTLEATERSDGWKRDAPRQAQPTQYDPTKAPADQHAPPIGSLKPDGTVQAAVSPPKPAGAPNFAPPTHPASTMDEASVRAAAARAAAGKPK